MLHNECPKTKEPGATFCRSLSDLKNYIMKGLVLITSQTKAKIAPTFKLNTTNNSSKEELTFINSPIDSYHDTTLLESLATCSTSGALKGAFDFPELLQTKKDIGLNKFFGIFCPRITQ